MMMYSGTEDMSQIREGGTGQRENWCDRRGEETALKEKHQPRPDGSRRQLRGEGKEAKAFGFSVEKENPGRKNMPCYISSEDEEVLKKKKKGWRAREKERNGLAVTPWGGKKA